MKKTVSFSSDAVNVFFHILTACNLNCRHCYINQDQHGIESLSPETIERWLALFSRKSKNTNMIFLGGEPSLHTGLPGVIKKARQHGYSSITVDTNGYLFNDILSKISPDDVDYFSFSLDGATRQTNDKIRGKGVYDRCIQGIKNAGAAGFSTSLIYTVSNKNLHELDRMGPILSDLGISRFFIQFIGIRGKSAENRHQNLMVSKADWTASVPEIADQIARNGITVTYPKVYLEESDPFECAARVAKNYFIFPNGRVYRCPLCEDHPIHSLEIKNGGLIDTPGINEKDLYQLTIPEGCVMNRLVQPENIEYKKNGSPAHQIACCLLKEEVRY